MKFLSFLATAVALLFPGVAASQTTDTAVVVAAKPVTHAQWSRTITRKLDRTLRSRSFFHNEVAPTGIVSVRFHAGDGGRPAGLELTRKSGERRLDRAAMEAIGRLQTLGPMPATFRTDQQFIANILFASDLDQLDRQTALLRREAAARSLAARSAALGGAAIDRSAGPIVLAVSSHAGVGSR